MGSVSRGFGKVLRAVDSVNFVRILTTSALDAVGLSGASDFLDTLGASPANLFDPQPPEYKYKSLKQDLQITRASEGDELPLIMGQGCKVSGALVWVGDVKKKVVKSSGGKGGADFSNPEAKTYADLLFLVSENPWEVGGGITEVRAGGQTIWRKDGTLTYDMVDDLTVVAGTFSGGLPKITITAPKNGTDLSSFYVGKDVTLSGFAAGTNGTWRVTKAKLYKKTQTTELICKDLSDTLNPSDETPASATLSQVLPNVKKYMDSAIELDGGPTQTMPTDYSDIEEFSPGYRLRGGMFMVRLNVLKVPSLFSLEFFVNERSTPLTLSEAVDLIMTYRTTLDPAEWDSSLLTGTVRNYVVGPGSAVSALQTLRTAFDFTYRDEGGLIKFFHNDNSYVDTVDIDDDYVGAIDGPPSSSNASPYDVGVRDPMEDPRRTVVSFTDVNNEAQRGTTTQVRYGVSSDIESTVDLLGLGLTPAEARVIAKRELYAVPSRWLSETVRLPPRYLGLRHDDIINIGLNGDIYPLRVGSVEEQDNYLMTVAAHTHANGIAYTAPDILTNNTKDPFTTELDVAAFKTAALTYAHLDVPGWYVSCSRTDDSTDWQGAELYKRITVDDAPTYDWLPVLSIEDEGVVGRFVAEESKYYGNWVASTLAPPSVSTWDIETEFVIELHSEEITLESRTDQEVLDGANRAMIGDELIAFANVEYLGDSKWKLTRLLRGLRDTLNPGTDEELWKINAFTGINKAPNLFTGHLPASGEMLVDLTITKSFAGTATLFLNGTGSFATVDGGAWTENRLLTLSGFDEAGNNGQFRISVDSDAIPGGLQIALIDPDDIMVTETKSTATVRLTPNVEKFVLVSGDGTVFREETLADLGKVNYYKLVPDNAEIDDVAEFAVDLQPTTIRYTEYDAVNRRGTLSPFRPSNITVTQAGQPGWETGAGDKPIVVEIERRTRALNHALLTPPGEDPYPILEEEEAYEVNFYYTRVGTPNINSNNYVTLFSTPVVPQTTLGTPIADLKAEIGGSGTANIVRETGSWIVDGYSPGEYVQLKGFTVNGANIGIWQIDPASTVTDTTLVILDPSDVWANEGPVAVATAELVINNMAPHKLIISTDVIDSVTSGIKDLGPNMRLEIWQLSTSVGRGSLSAFEISSDGVVTLV